MGAVPLTSLGGVSYHSVYIDVPLTFILLSSKLLNANDNHHGIKDLAMLKSIKVLLTLPVFPSTACTP